jgi:drug/metabolite transporter (DMT)-like permease
MCLVPPGAAQDTSRRAAAPPGCGRGRPFAKLRAGRGFRRPAPPPPNGVPGRRAPPRERNEPIVRNRRVGLALAANQVLASATHIFAKGAVVSLGALPVALLRFGIASVTLGGWQRLRGAPGIERRDWPRVALLGFLVVPMNQGFFLFGMVHSTPSHASLLYALTPLVVFLLARVMIRERTPWSALVGIVIAFAGVIVILTERGLRNEMGVLRGDLLILVAVFAWALYTVLSKPLLARYDAMAVTTGAIVSGTLMTLPALLVPGALPPLRSLTLPVGGAVLYLAIGTSVIAYPLYMYALRHLDTAKVAVAQNTQPVITSILSWLLFRERFSPAFFLGAGLILAGVTWVETRRAKG